MCVNVLIAFELGNVFEKYVHLVPSRHQHLAIVFIDGDVDAFFRETS